MAAWYKLMGTSTQGTVDQMIAGASTVSGVSPSLVLAKIATDSDKNFSTTNPYELGATIASQMSDLNTQFPSDPRLPLLASITSPETAQQTMTLMSNGMSYQDAVSAAVYSQQSIGGLPDDPSLKGTAQQYADSVLQTQQQIQTQGNVAQSNIPPATSTTPTPAVVVPSTDTISSAPTAAKPINTTDISAADYAGLSPSVVVTEGLSETPWYNDTGLITANPHLRKTVQPVSFQVMLRDVGGNVILSNNGTSGTPIEVQLNTSLKLMRTTSKHMFHQEKSRTGFHITLWGMAADMIEGQGTTGLFMNQFGVTDYFSTASPNEDLKALVTSGMMFGSQSVTIPATPTGTSPLDIARAAVTPGTLSSNVYSSPASYYSYDTRVNAVATNPQEAFRVAAQDAFMEFVALFKNNGIVWFHNDNQNAQQATAAWSPQLGMSNAQMNARNNDVRSRGAVIMRVKSNTYMGYFKNLSWEMNANNPFLWNFTFVFQVERTVNLLYYPK